MWENSRELRKIDREVAKTEAKQVIKDYDLKAPVDLMNLLNKLDIEYKEAEEIENPESSWGEVWASLERKKEEGKTKFIITTSKKIFNKNTKRFNVAHELSHYFLDYYEKKDISYRTKYMNDPKEEKYNIFAINLLIPDNKKFWEYKKQGFSNSELADYYGIPFSAVEIFANEWKGF